MKAPKTNNSHISVVLENYFLERTDHLRSKGAARHAGRLMLECWGEIVKVNALTEEQQKKFVRWSLARNHAIAYVSRNIGVLAAAMAHGKVKIDLTYSEGAILAKWPEFKPKPPREIYEPTDQELGRLLRANIPQNLRRWVMNSMATGGRPEAVLQLSPSSRQRELGLINLNPAGRRQNKKYRATVRELRVQTQWLNEWERAATKAAKRGMELPPEYCTYASVDSLDTALRRVRLLPEIDVPRISAYSIRNRVASVLRASKTPRVSGDQISYQLGHRRPTGMSEARTTRGYGEFGPDYLSEAAQALEAWVLRVLALAAEKPCRQFPRNSHNRSRGKGKAA